MQTLPYYLSMNDARKNLGMVIPVWFSAAATDESIRQLLTITISGFDSFVCPERLLLVVDGPQRAGSIADELRTICASADSGPFRVLHLPENIGKGGAVAAGIEKLLEDDRVQMVMVRDADGDHVINDGPNLVRLGAQISSEQRTGNWIVVGGRVDVHRPLGFIRGQYEGVVNSVLWHSCIYHLSGNGATLNTQYFAAYGDVPDCESGYKLYGREACSILVEGFSRARTAQPDVDVSRWSSEVLPVVETLVSGGFVGQVPRLTYNEQPTSSYVTSGRAECYAQRLCWLLRRLNIPMDVARQFIDNALSRSLLLMERDGRDELLTMRAATIRQAYGDAGIAGLTPLLHGSFLC